MQNTVICRDGICKYKKVNFTDDCPECDIVEKVEMDLLKETFVNEDF